MRHPCRCGGTSRRMKISTHRIIYLRLAKGGRVTLVLRARELDRPQRPGAPQIVAPFWEARRTE